MTWLIWVLVPLFALAAVLAVIRLIKGPSVLDRIVAADVLVATLICALGAEMAIDRHAYSLPVVLVLALFAVFGSISVAKFMANQDDTQPSVDDVALAEGEPAETDADGTPERPVSTEEAAEANSGETPSPRGGRS